MICTANIFVTSLVINFTRLPAEAAAWFPAKVCFPNFLNSTPTQLLLLLGDKNLSQFPLKDFFPRLFRAQMFFSGYNQGPNFPSFDLEVRSKAWNGLSLCLITGSSTLGWMYFKDNTFKTNVFWMYLPLIVNTFFKQRAKSKTGRLSKYWLGQFRLNVFQW